MRTIPDIKLKVKLLIIFVLITATWASPLTLMAADTARAQMERHIVVFDPYQGAFPASETRDGVRFVPVGGSTLTDFPPNPEREGYIFDGWRLPGGARLETNYLFVNEAVALTAMWRAYGEEATHTLPPNPQTQSPAPTTSPSPTPTPHDAARPNPSTNPLAISFLVSFAVLALGIAAFGIIKLTARHAMATGQYMVDATRYEREARLADLLKEDDTNIE